MKGWVTFRRVLICLPIFLVMVILAMGLSLYFCLFYQPSKTGSSHMSLVKNSNSPMDSIEDCYFDVGAVSDGFTASLVAEDDVDLKAYIEAYKELSKFFMSMGKLFSFIANDVEAKLGILDEFVKGKDAENFTTVKKMLTYEMEADLIEKKDYVSGSRTLLRLHRGLDFLRKFLQKVGEANNTESLSKVGHDVYSDTLAHHHPWIVRKGANLAMYALPTREGLMHKLYGDNEDRILQAIESLPKMLSAANEVYTRTDNIYTSNKLHELP